MATAPANNHVQLLLGMQIDLSCLAADRHSPAIEQTNPLMRSPSEVTDVTEDAQPSSFLTEEEATPETTHKKAPWREADPGDKPEADPEAAPTMLRMDSPRAQALDTLRGAVWEF